MREGVQNIRFLGDIIYGYAPWMTIHKRPLREREGVAKIEYWSDFKAKTPATGGGRGV